MLAKQRPQMLVAAFRIVMNEERSYRKMKITQADPDFGNNLDGIFV